MSIESYSIDEIADVAGISRHTVRSYVAQGLISPPGVKGGSPSKGPNAKYGRDVLDRVRAIRVLREQGESLNQIKQTLAALTNEDIQRLAEGRIEAAAPPSGPAIEPPASSILDYIRAARETAAADAAEPLDTQRRPPARPGLMRRAPRHEDPDQLLIEGFGGGQSEFTSLLTGLRRVLSGQRVDLGARPREWVRVEITRDVELHVRGPLDPQRERELRLIANHIRHLIQKGLPND